MPRFRRGASVLSTLLVAVAVILVSGACGSGAIEGPDEASEQGGAAQDSTSVIDTEGSDGTTATDRDDSDETPTSTTGEPPTTLAPGSAGVSTDAGGNQIIIIPGCVINVTERIESQQYVVLRRELRCILDNPAAVPDEVLDAARVADALAKGRLTEADTDPGSDPAATAGTRASG